MNITPSNHFSRNPNSGFTLIELLIVVVILSSLASIVTPSFFDTTDSSKNSVNKQNAKIVQAAIDRFHADHGRFPGPYFWEGKEACVGIDREKYRTGEHGMDKGLLLRNRLILRSNASGDVCDSFAERHGKNYPFGPYLSKALPTNQRNNSGRVYVSNAELTGNEDLSDYGWHYNYNNGSFTALSI